jgi:predicted dienelactone hydrolase
MTRPLVRVAVFVVSILIVARADAEERSLVLGGLRVAAWSRDLANLAGEPVVVFSHGFHGCATQSRFLMEAMAEAGYLVLAPNHRDAACNGGSASRSDGPEEPFHAPSAWSAASYDDRREDVRRLLEAAKSDPDLGRADWSRLALAGHSLGGYTVLGLAGAWPEWKLPGVMAVLALSPYSQPFLAHGTIGGVSVPVMYQGGTRDFGITPAIDKTAGAYERSADPKYLVVLAGAGHFAWTNLGRERFREPIVRYSLAFLDRYVRGDGSPARLDETVPGVAMLRHEP